jgi:Spy/CpxP family protein refolding chaperone
MKSSVIALKIWIMASALSLTMVSAALCATISQAQKDQLKELAVQTGQKARSERQNLTSARRELLDIYSKYDLNENKAKSAISKIQQSQLKLLNIHLEHQIGIRKILSSSQFAGFRERVGNKMRDRGNESMGRMDTDIFADKSLLDGLNLSAEKKQKAQSKLGELTKRRANMIGNMHNNFKRMMDLYAGYELDMVAAKRLIAKTHKLQSELTELSLKRQQAIRSLLTETQFNTFMSRVNSKMKSQGLGQKGRRRGSQ